MRIPVLTPHLPRPRDRRYGERFGDLVAISPLSHHTRGVALALSAATLVTVGVLLGLADQPAPVGGAEDEEDGGEAEDDRPGGHRDLGADREGEDGGARGGVGGGGEGGVRGG